MRLFLVEAGHEVHGAGTGREGWRLMLSTRPDVVLLDLTLPDMDGWEVLRRARDEPATSGIPVVIVSANAFPGERLRASHQGGVEFIPKPFRIEDVVDRVNALSRSRRLAARRAAREAAASATAAAVAAKDAP